MQFFEGMNRVAALTFVLAACAAAGGLTACGEDEGNPIPTEGGAVPSYEQVSAVLGTSSTQQSSCSVASCHGAGVADLQLSAGVDLIAETVNVPACEAPELMLVEPGNPERSWLYIKLAGEITDPTSGELVVQPSWGEPSTDCPNAPGFGKRMPRVSPFELEQEKLSIVYDWIKGGAPGPM